MVKFVFFDLDDTILDFNKAERTAIKKTFKSYSIKTNKNILDLYSKINLNEWKRLEKKELTHEQVKVHRFEVFLKEINKNFNATEMTKNYEKNLAKEHFVIRGALSVIKSIYKDYRLFIVSNGLIDVQSERIKSAKIKKYFERIFVSQDIGFNKPEKEFFESCFNQIEGFNREEAVIIGDSLSSDIAGGKNVKIKTLWYNCKGVTNRTDIIPDFEIKKLKEIKDILKRI